MATAEERYNETMGKLADVITQVSDLAMKTTTIMVAQETRLKHVEGDNDDIDVEIEKIEKRLVVLERAKWTIYGAIGVLTLIGGSGLVKILFWG